MPGKIGARVFLLAVGAFCCTLLIVPTASAYTEQQVEDLSAALEETSPQQVPGVTSAPASEDLEQLLNEPAPEETGFDTLASEEGLIKTNEGLFPKLKTFGRWTLERSPEIVAGGAALYVGYKAGEKIYDLFLGDSGPDDPYTGAKSPTNATFVDKGDLLFQNGLTGHETDAPAQGRVFDYHGFQWVYVRSTPEGWPPGSCNTGTFWPTGDRVNMLRGHLVLEPAGDANLSGSCMQRTGALFEPLRSGEYLPGGRATGDSGRNTWYGRPAPSSAQDLYNDVADALDSGDYPLLEQVLNRCTPNPQSSSVVVPQVLPNELPGHYEDCLESLGLEGNRIVGSETDTTVNDGAIVDTYPESGAGVAPGATVDEHLNPAEAKEYRRDERCELEPPQGPLGPPPDVAEDSPYKAYPYYQYVEGSPYHLSYDPTAENGERGREDVELRWGTNAFGLTHIRMEHSYTAWDRAQTEAALDTDLDPHRAFAGTPQYHYRLPYTVSLDNGDNLQCVRVVTVEFYPDKGAVAAGIDSDDIRGVQNSYVGVPTG
jgi:hypothetical protein